MIRNTSGCSTEEPAERAGVSGMLAAAIAVGVAAVIACVAFVLLRVPAMQEDREQDALAQRYTEYVRAVLDCAYHGDLSEYIRITGSSMTAAQRIHDEKTEQLAQTLRTFCGMDGALLSETQEEELEQLARMLLRKTVYTVGDGTVSDGTYSIPVIIRPIAVWEAAEDAGGSSEQCLAALYEAAEDMPYAPQECYTATIRIDSEGLYGLDEKEWQAIEGLLLNTDCSG